MGTKATKIHCYIGTQVISGAKIGHGRSQRCQWAALSISQSAPQPGNICNVYVHVHVCEIVNLTNSRVSAMEIMVCLMGSFPFVQLKAGIQRFGAVRHFDLEQSAIDLGLYFQ